MSFELNISWLMVLLLEKAAKVYNETNEEVETSKVNVVDLLIGIKNLGSHFLLFLGRGYLFNSDTTANNMYKQRAHLKGKILNKAKATLFHKNMGG